ncbi:MAG TPA: molybdopterin-dependent oxidoreductase [Candidatus Binatia bacterium]
MEQKSAPKYFPTVGDGSGLAQTDGLYKEELQLALRNRGMPLEALRYPITPTGLHYLLIHYDIPEVNAEQWHLKIGGLVGKPLELTLDEIKKRPRRTMPVTMECAGNGRALFAPRRISQPWLLEAIGNAEWTGTSLRAILQDAGLGSAAVEIVFTGLDQGVEGDQFSFISAVSRSTKRCETRSCWSMR